LEASSAARFALVALGRDGTLAAGAELRPPGTSSRQLVVLGLVLAFVATA